MNKSLKFIKNSMIYFLGNVLTKIISFLLIPLYTKLIDPAEYGSYDLIVSIINLVIPIIFFQIWDGIFRFIYDYDSKEDKYAIITNGLVVTCFSTIIYMLLFVILNSIYHVENLFLILIYGLSISLHYIYGTIARTFEKNVLYMGTGVLNSIINIMLNIIFIKFMGMKTEAFYISASIGTLVQIILIEFNLKTLKHIKKEKISKEVIIKMVKFSMPIAITTISYWLLSGFTKVIITKELGSAENGKLAIVNKFASLITIIVSVFQMSWHEISFSLVNDRNKKVYYEKGINLFLIIMFLGIGIIIPLTKIIFPYMVNINYMSAITIIPITYTYTIFNALASFMSTQLLAEKDSKGTFYSTIIAAGINIILSILLTKKYGIVGANIALLISFLINTIVIGILLRKKYNIQITKKGIFTALLICGCTMIVFYKFGTMVNIIYMLIIMVIASVVLYKVLGKSIKEVIKTWAKK